MQGEERVFSSLCGTAGHDTLWVLEDRTVPSVVQIEYTITNTGNAPLAGCDAAIVLPPMFVCANHADSIQSFGTIPPGGSASRQWLLTVNLDSVKTTSQTFRWVMSCDSLQATQPCAYTIQPLYNVMPTRLVLEPWKLRFAARQNGALPPSQQVTIDEPHDGGIVWQLQTATPWLDYQPSSGSTTLAVDVRPNTTALPVAVHGGAIDIAPPGLVSPRSSIAVEYDIYTTTGASPAPQPTATTLEQNYPNPVTRGGITTIVCSLAHDGYAALKVYDMLGREALSSFSAQLPAGRHVVSISTANLRPGVYAYTLTYDGLKISRSMVVLE